MFLVFLAIQISLSWGAGLGFGSPADILHSEIILASEEGAEFRAALLARAPNTSWEIEFHECAMLKVFVDERYDQHLFLLGGAQEQTYDFLIGPLSKGKHLMRIEWDRSWSPRLEDRPELRGLKLQPLDRSNPAQEPILRAPIVHIRKDTVGRFSDLPLVLYWEVEERQSRKYVTYTIILSNEDGGTNTERLMARWGRTTDIEWFYAYSPSGGRIEETYQGRDHKTLPFRGRHEGWHPVLYDVTQNNMFADEAPDPAEVRLRLAPVEANLRAKSRESVMDRFPWTYAVMAQEMKREGKIEEDSDPKTAKISDLRNYAFLEVCALQRGTEIYFELQVEARSGWFSSDHSDPKARIGRDGCFRSTVELPAGTRPENLRQLRIQCVPAPVAEGERPVSSPQAGIQAVTRLFFLEANYQPGRNLLDKKINRTLKPGRSLIVRIPK